MSEFVSPKMVAIDIESPTWIGTRVPLTLRPGGHFDLAAGWYEIEDGDRLGYWPSNSVDEAKEDTHLTGRNRWMIQFIAGRKAAGFKAEIRPKLLCTTCQQEEELNPEDAVVHDFSSLTEFARWRVQVFTDKHLDCCI